LAVVFLLAVWRRCVRVCRRGVAKQEHRTDGVLLGLFFLAGADFVGAMQLMIYVGGTLVLLIFGVMLTSQQRFIEMKTQAGDWVFAFAAGGALLFALIQAAWGIPAWQGLERAEADQLTVEKTASPIAMGLVGLRPDKSEQPDETLREGMSGYLLIFEIVSVHLLVVLIGAAYLARAKHRKMTIGGEQ